MYSYDRRTAASMDFHQEWREIVSKYSKGLQKDLEGLLKKAVPYLKSVGYDLDLNKSYLGVDQRASDPDRIAGTLFITEREENTVQAPNADSVKKWVNEALGLYSYPKKLSEGPEKGRDGRPLITWEVDIGDY